MTALHVAARYQAALVERILAVVEALTVVRAAAVLLL
jgi:hypothetical protein